MKNNIIIFLAFGIIVLFSNCEKDETKIILNDPILPAITSLPTNLTLERDNSENMLTFKGTPLDPSYQVSVKYFLEADTAGNNFAKAVEIYSGIQDTTMQISVGQLNETLLRSFPEDKLSSVEFRIRALLIQDGGTGVPSNEFNSESEIGHVTTFGLPALYITDDTYEQRLVSAKNDGKYIGWVSTDGTAFTLTNKDNGSVYGLTGGNIAENGPAFSVGTGIIYVEVDLNALTMANSADETWGIIGSAIPPYDWSVDIDMTFDINNQYWKVTGDFIGGEYKFRADNAWTINYGDTGADGVLDAGGDNIKLTGAGNYTIILYNKKSYSATKN